MFASARLLCPQEQPLWDAVAPLHPLQGVPLCVLFGSSPALYLHPLYSSARIEARKHIEGQGTGTEGEGGVCHGQCNMVVVVAQTNRPRGWQSNSSTSNAVRLLLALRFLAGAVARLMCTPQVDRSMLGDSIEKVDAERNLLGVLWSYCMMEEAAGCALKPP